MRYSGNLKFQALLKKYPPSPEKSIFNIANRRWIQEIYHRLEEIDAPVYIIINDT